MLADNFKMIYYQQLMEIARLAEHFEIPIHQSDNSMAIYSEIRRYFFDRYKTMVDQNFQSPSIDSTTHPQRSIFQLPQEHGVYQRADFTPLRTERQFNGFQMPIGEIQPVSLFFNSGMAAIGSLAFYLRNNQRVPTTHIGENSYFETKWIYDSYDQVNYVNEYQDPVPQNFDLLWMEYPINCTRPEEYPFNNQLDLESLIPQTVDICEQNPDQQKSIVVDYTLHPIPLDLSSHLSRLPENLSLFLVTSLQKHRGYGLDLVNGGAVTFYGKRQDEVYEEVKKIRTIMGTSFTQESLWLMPEIRPQLINQLILDSGENARNLALEIPDTLGAVKKFYSDNNRFKTSFIYLIVNDLLVQQRTQPPYLIDLLISHLVESAQEEDTLLVHGTSFGLPYTRLFKNAERYQNCTSLRIAVGYDEKMNQGLDKALTRGIGKFNERINQYLS